METNSKFLRKKIGNLLKEYLSKKIIMGSSSGAMILGMEQPISLFRARYGNNAGNIVEEAFMRLVPFSIIPHFRRPDHTQINDEFLNYHLHDSPFPLFALQDSQAVFFDGKIHFCGVRVK